MNRQLYAFRDMLYELQAMDELSAFQAMTDLMDKRADTDPWGVPWGVSVLRNELENQQ